MAEGDSWQFSKSVVECNRHMLEKGIATDVTFVVSNNLTSSGICSGGAGSGDTDQEVMKRTFQAHKYVLISRSPVFYAMLCGDMAEKGDIIIEDVEPDAFEQMLNYIYTDDVDLKPELVMFILYASKKYLLPGLTSLCTNYLSEKVKASNACIVLDQCMIFDEKELAERCMKIVKGETKLAMESETFLDIRKATLSKILDSDKFTVKEVSVFLLCVNWAKHKCKQLNMDATGENMREILGECVAKMRFPAIDVNEFSSKVCPCDILTSKEEISLFRYITNKKEAPAPQEFNAAGRFFSSPCLIEADDVQSMNTVQLGNTTFTVTLSCDTDIEVSAISVGTWLSGICVTSTAMISVLNENNVFFPGFAGQVDGKKQEWKFNNYIPLKKGENKLVLQYSNSCGVTAPVNVIQNNETTFKDKYIEIKATSNQPYMPIVGLQYSFGS